MEKINKRNAARCDRFLGIVAVFAKEITVIAGRNLGLDVRHGKLFDPELIQHSWQHTPDSLQDDFLVPS